MRIGLLGGLRVEHDGRPIPVAGAMQLAVLFRLAVDAGTSVSYRAIAEDIWGIDAPENTKGALQSIVSRLRSQLPSDSIESTAGGYRLNIARSEVDALEFSDLVAAAVASESPAHLASDALALWSGEPWVPSENFDWFQRDLARDHATAIELGGSAQRTRSPSEGPLPLTTIVGRERELVTIAEQLSTNRLVTVIGTGGAGKTRIAIEVASARPSARVVELAPVGPSEVLAAVLTATGREIRALDAAAEGTNTRDRVLDALAGRDILLVFDNCEHVIDSAASVVQDLLSALPHLRILATSREPLGIPGESFVLLGSLAHPADSEIDGLLARDFRGYAAIQLFAERGASARGAGLGDDELPAAARICARLDGLPLAIELAAAKLRTMGVDEVLGGLDDRFALLTGGYRTALPRHQTLRAMMDWSWSLLDDHERAALLHFAVFPAGLSAADARMLAERLRLPDGVFDDLVDRSLLQRAKGRFRALETVREYGINRLSELGTLAGVRELQATFMADRAAVMDKQLRGPRIMDSIAWFDAEEDNLASALRYVTSAPQPDLALRLAVSSAWYWIVRDRSDEAQGWYKRIIPLAALVDSDEARVISMLGTVMEQVNETSAEENFGRVPDGLGELLDPLRDLSVGPGGHDLMQLVHPIVEAFAQAVATQQPIMSVQVAEVETYRLDAWPTAILHIARAAMAQNVGNLALLGTESEIALELFERQGDIWGIALSEQMRSIWLGAVGRLEEALELGDRSTEHMRDITTEWDLAQQQSLSIQMLYRLGRTDEALDRLGRMLEIARESEVGRTIMQANMTAASLGVQLGDFAMADACLRKIDSVRDSWHGEPPQISAMIEAIHAAIEMHNGDFGAAEARLRSAADAAIKSLDHPVIGMIAIAVGKWALVRGDVATAVRAVDFSTAMIGAYDFTHPDVIAIDLAAQERGIERPSTEVPKRPIALPELRELFGS